MDQIQLRFGEGGEGITSKKSLDAKHWKAYNPNRFELEDTACTGFEITSNKPFKNPPGNMTKIKAHLLRSVAVLAASLCFGTSAFASIVFDNSVNLLSPPRSFSPGNNVEFGDQVFLAGSDRRVSDFQFDYFVSTNASGNELAEIFFYDNNGTNGAPGTLLYRSGEFSLGTGFQTVIAQQLSVTVPTTFTWAVVFKGVDLSEQAGLLLADPPTVGTSLSDFWVRNSDGSWNTFLIDNGATPANFVARITAVPEPSTYALGVLGLMALAWANRRRCRS